MRPTEAEQAFLKRHGWNWQERSYSYAYAIFTDKDPYNMEFDVNTDLVTSLYEALYGNEDVFAMWNYLLNTYDDQQIIEQVRFCQLLKELYEKICLDDPERKNIEDK